MRSFKPGIAVAVLGFSLVHLVPAQENTPAPSAPPKAASAPATSSSSSSEATGVVAPPPDQPKSDDASSIKVSVNEVIVPVTVTDDKGRFVSDLDKKDFTVFE